MKLRKPGPLSAADKTWIRNYQDNKGAKVDGSIGRETLDHIKADLTLRHQPDDPGAGKPRPGAGPELGFFVVLALAAAVVAALFAAFG